MFDLFGADDNHHLVSEGRDAFTVGLGDRADPVEPMDPQPLTQPRELI